jgi:uncharacterized protein (TIGR00369 family)
MERRAVSVARRTEPWQEPVRGATADASLLELPGIDQLRAFVEGRAPAPPVARLTGRRLVAADGATVVYALPVSDWLVGPKGTVHPGVLSFLADAPLLAAVQATLPPATVATTAELSTTFLGTAARGDELRAEARVIHVDGSTGLAEVEITRRDGSLIGHATSRVFILREARARRSASAEDADERSTPDPYLRPVEGDTLPASAFAHTSGLELLQQQLAGLTSPPPIDLLTGIRLVAADEGTVSFALAAHPWTANEFGTMFGGMLALLAASAGSAAVQTTAPAGTAFKALDLKLNIIRPVRSDGRELVATGRVLHRGWQLAIAGTEILDDAGRQIAVATGTTMVGAAAD